MQQLVKLASVYDQVRQAGGRVYVCGNGGSCANAAHLVSHLRDVGIKAFDLLADAPWVSAVANDQAYDKVFSWTLHALGAGPEDLLTVISGSGNSKNIIEAAVWSRAVSKMPVWGLLGMGGGQVGNFCDGKVVVDSDDYGVIEDVHSICIHALKKALTIS